MWKLKSTLWNVSTRCFVQNLSDNAVCFWHSEVFIASRSSQLPGVIVEWHFRSCSYCTFRPLATDDGTRIRDNSYLNTQSHISPWIWPGWKRTVSYHEIVPLSALIAFNAMNWPGGDALSFSYRFHHWLMLYTLGQYIVNVQSSTTSGRIFNYLHIRDMGVNGVRDTVRTRLFVFE